ncbi:HNH endonuclease [Paenibacillus sophorae]|uniref:DUF262 domain-containing protein n=1 Tax=Paenibacillus sophorae TaxID=1333845 RepID=A0A1H8L6G7_9BACL|nr:DUF262 domain-containing protein [Paenibacillus sophorae]QWU17411.1 DUF262 domain-containing protein [Paenibacillus sophorae]SEO00772.1 HNH endonuclease [Paenibacillus sophorae]
MAGKIKLIPNANLDHIIPSDSLLTTTDYLSDKVSDEVQYHKKEYLDFKDFQPDFSGFSIWDRFRKPEFQRQTNSWTDEKYINLLKTLKNNQVIPGVIFWLNPETGHIFVLDGAHRLSAIRGWITNDWGDSDEAKEYGYLEEDEIRASARLRQSVKDSIGDFEECRKAISKFKKIVDQKKNPKEELDPKIEEMGRFMYHLNTSLKVPIQWVTGGYQDAEQSFVNINTGGTPLSTEEALFIENRRSPVARAMAGIISNGSKPSLWIDHGEKCTKLSQTLYKLLLAPSDNIPSKIKVSDYPLILLKKQNSYDRYQFLQYLFCIIKHGQTGDNNITETLKHLANESNDEVVADATLDELERTLYHITSLIGNSPQSLGVLPVFYFYSSKGQYSNLLFFSFLMWLFKGTEKEILNRKLEFTLHRSYFEEMWILIKDHVIKHLGRKGGPSRLSKNQAELFNSLIECIKKCKVSNTSPDEAVEIFLKDLDSKAYSEYLKKKNESGKPFSQFSSNTKIQQEVAAYFEGSYKCELCKGAIDLGVSQQFDHIELRSLGGTNSINNGRVVHPWCNNHRDKLPKPRYTTSNPIDPPQIEPKPDLVYNQVEFNF